MIEAITRHNENARILSPTSQTAGFDYDVNVIGKTPHVTVFAATSLGQDGVTVAEGCLRHCEDDYVHLHRLFGSVEAPPMNLIVAPLSSGHDGTGGAYHYGCQATDLYCDVQFNPVNIWTTLALFVAEAVEVFEACQGQGWDCGGSNGEGLSRVIASAIHPIVLQHYSTASAWLNTQGRPNYVDINNSTDRDKVSNGCSTLFLTWLHRKFTYSQICQAPGATLAATYHKLTGLTTAWADFMADVNARWPAGQPVTLSTDDPW